MTEKKFADPSALGLFGLAIVTLVASSSKLGITDGTALVLPWAMFLGGVAQIVAGIYDYKKLNIFGATAFFSYGLFWLAVSLTWFITAGGFGDNFTGTMDPKALGFAYIGYFIITFFLTIGSMETNKVLFIIFILIDILFIGLALGTFIDGSTGDAFKKVAGVAELMIAIVSFYGAGANVLNIHFEKTFLPIGKPFGIFKK